MKSLAELEAIRKKTKDELNVRSGKGGKRIVVGMATCGIAAGARTVMTAIVNELGARGITDTKVTITGCIGVCRLEPIVEVYDENDVRTTYVNMNEDKGRRIVAEHIINNRVCKDLTITAEDKVD